MRHFPSRGLWHGVHAGAASAVLAMAGCGGHGGSPESTPSSVAAAPAAPSEADASPPLAPSPQGRYDNAVTSYDRFAAPAGGEAAISQADIATAQAAFDKIGDDLSEL